MSPKEIDRISISSRLLAQEALSRNFQLTAYFGSSGGSPIIRCHKGDKYLWFKGLHTCLDSPFGTYIERDKALTYEMLATADLPYPDTIVLEHNDTNYPDTIKLLQKHEKLVVKPTCADHGDGVTIDIDNEASLKSAVAYARENSADSQKIIVQQQVTGQEYRFLVLGNKVIAVANRRPPFVVGNGIKTVRELIEVKNSDPLRGDEHSLPLTKINLDEVAHFIGRGKLDYVPTNGEKVEVLKTSNLSRGGESMDVTDAASSALKEMAVAAAQTCQLGIAGVDIITEDIENGSAKDSFIIEVNASPGLRMHHFPSVGQPRNVAAMIFDELEKAPLK
jgi:cyanophycin synthetase